MMLLHDILEHFNNFLLFLKTTVKLYQNFADLKHSDLCGVRFLIFQSNRTVIFNQCPHGTLGVPGIVCKNLREGHWGMLASCRPAAWCFLSIIKKLMVYLDSFSIYQCAMRKKG